MNYIETIRKSVTYIENHLFEDLTPKKIADTVHFSEFHFQRIFKKDVGYSVMEYINKRRLSVSVYNWCLSRKTHKLIDLSLGLGYSCQSAMTRAFKNNFGQLPSEWYKRCQSMICEEIFPPINLWHTNKQNVLDLYNPQMTIVHLDAFTALGKSMHSTLNEFQNYKDVEALETQVNQLWRNTQEYHKNKAIEIGIASNIQLDPFLPYNVEFDYFRGFIAVLLNRIPKEMCVKKIPAGDYVRFVTTTHPLAHAKTLQFIYNQLKVSVEKKQSMEATYLIEKFPYTNLVLGDQYEVEIFVSLAAVEG